MENNNASTGNYYVRFLPLPIEYVESQFTKDYIVNRLIPQMVWYNKKSAQHREEFMRGMIASGVLSALIPVATVLAEGDLLQPMRVLIAVLGAGVSIISTYLSVCQSKDLWITYRKCRESLLQTLYKYFNNVDEFSHPNTQAEKDALLIHICEETLSYEIAMLDEQKQEKSNS